MRSAMILSGFILALFAISCGSARKGYSYSEDKTLYDKVKKFKKHPEDTRLRNELQTYYDLAMKQHQDRIKAYRQSPELSRYDRILAEYQTMQQLSDEIRNSPAFQFIPTINYYEIIGLTKEEAAAAWYAEGLDYQGKDDRKEYRKAYDAFGKSMAYVAGYKDAEQLRQQVFDKSVVEVVINPVMDNRFLLTGWNGHFQRENIQESLVRDLGGSSGKYIPARFYTDWEARRNDIEPNWIVDLEWSNLYFPQPVVSHFSRNLSRKIEVGSDSLGKTVYQTVYATLQVTRRQITAEAEMSYTIREADSHHTISWNRVPGQYSRLEEFATYTGDSRALGSNDWALINNRYNRPLSREEMIQELYRQIYPALKNRLRNDISW